MTIPRLIFHITCCSHETDGKGIALTNTTLGNGDSVTAGDAAALVYHSFHFRGKGRGSKKSFLKMQLLNFQVAGQAEPGEELPLPETVDKWHYVSLK